MGASSLWMIAPNKTSLLLLLLLYLYTSRKEVTMILSCEIHHKTLECECVKEVKQRILDK